MGVPYLSGEVKGPKGKKTVKFLIDRWATYWLLPLDVWKKIGLKPKRNLEFTLLDGTVIRRKVSKCYIKLAKGEGHTPVILGEDSNEALNQFGPYPQVFLLRVQWGV